MAQDRLPRIVIAGGGIGGTAAAFALRDALGERAEILLVSDREKFRFTPSNPWVAIGWRDPAAIAIDLKGAMAHRGIEFVPSAVTALAPRESHIVLHDGQQIGYDQLIIATGPELAFDEVEGLAPGGNIVSVCTTAHAIEANAAFERFCDDPGPIVVGAAPGASCFGPAYEYALMLDTELRRRRLRSRAPITFATPEPYVGHLGLGGVGDSRGMLEHELRSRDIPWIVNARLKHVGADKMTFEEMHVGGAATDHTLDFGLAMILPAFRGVGFLRTVEGLVNPRGFVLVDEHQRNPAFPNVHALGVCVAIPPVGPTPVPVGVPKTGFMIESIAAAIAENIAAILDGREATARPTLSAICLADFGDGGMAFIAQPQIPPRDRVWSAEGHWVHLAKVGFEKYFLHKVRSGVTEPVYERLALKAAGLARLAPDPAR